MRDRILENLGKHQIRSVEKALLDDLPQEQRILTEKLILPHQEEIVADVRELRTRVDEYFSNDAKIQKLASEGRPYPIGQCRPIRDQILKRIIANRDPSKLGLVAIAEFVKRGGVVSPFWAIWDGKYFQNAIQLGTAILDAAYNTIDPQEDPVVFFPSIPESSFERIKSFEQIASIAESYWGYDIYPNVFRPDLAPIFPIMAVAKSMDSDSQMELRLLVNAKVLARANMESQHDGMRCGLAHQFITESPYSKKPFPPEYVEAAIKAAGLTSHQGLFVRRGGNVYLPAINSLALRESFGRLKISGSQGELVSHIKLLQAMETQGNKFIEKPLAILS